MFFYELLWIINKLLDRDVTVAFPEKNDHSLNK